jgi:thioredoxin-related protein
MLPLPTKGISIRVQDFLVFTLLLLMLVLVMHATALAQSSIAWHTSDQEGFQVAQAHHKPTMIYFTSERCAQCKEQWKVFADPEVINLSQEFAPLIGSRWLEGEYGIRYVPVIVFTNSRGEEIYRIVGYHDAPALMEEMQHALRLASQPAQTPFHDPYASDTKIPGWGMALALIALVFCRCWYKMRSRL